MGSSLARQAGFTERDQAHSVIIEHVSYGRPDNSPLSRQPCLPKRTRLAPRLGANAGGKQYFRCASNARDFRGSAATIPLAGTERFLTPRDWHPVRAPAARELPDGA